MFDGRSQIMDYLQGGSLQERHMLQPGFLIYTCLERNNWDTVKDNFLKPGRVNTEYCSPMNGTTGKEVWLTLEAPEYSRPVNMWGPLDGGL